MVNSNCQIGGCASVAVSFSGSVNIETTSVTRMRRASAARSRVPIGSIAVSMSRPCMMDT